MNFSDLSRDELIKKLTEASALIDKQNILLSSKDERIKVLEEALRIKKEREYIRKADKAYEDSMPLFNDIEFANKEDEVFSKIEDEQEYEKVAEYKRKKKKNFVNLENTNLEVQVIDHKLNDNQFIPINSYDSVRILCYIPAKYYIEEHRFYKYKDGKTIITARDDFFNPFGKSNVSTAFVSKVVVDKVIKSLPLFRQEKSFNLDGLDISRMDLSNYCSKAYDICKPLVDKIAQYVKTADVVRSDETSLKIIKNSNAPNSKSNAYVWAFSTGLGYFPATIYQLGPGRNYEVVQSFFEKKNYFLQSDFYSAYLKNKNRRKNLNITNVFCLAHMRRKFVDIVKHTKVPEDSPIHEIISLIGKIYYINDLIEQKNCKLTGEEFFNEVKADREKHLKPIAIKLFELIEKENKEVLPKSTYGNALTYALKMKDGFFNIFQDGRLELDNNASERKIKDFVIGRKNWLFSNTANGAEITCGLYSLLRTAVENELKPFEYLKYLLDNLSILQAQGKLTSEELEKFLPRNDEIQTKFKSHSY